jgi:hypothetical protein
MTAPATPPVAPVPPPPTAPVETSPTAARIRAELAALLEAEPFGIAELHRIGAIAKAGRALLQAVSVTDPAQLPKRAGISFGNSVYSPSSDDIDLTPSIAGGGVAETFGATALREVKEILPHMLDKRPSVTQIVHAMAAAKAAELTEVQTLLREQLDEALEIKKPAAVPGQDKGVQ